LAAWRRSGLSRENLRPEKYLSNLKKFSKRKTVPLFRQTAVICRGFSAASLRKKNTLQTEDEYAGISGAVADNVSGLGVSGRN